jgi:hypothetical protein
MNHKDPILTGMENFDQVRELAHLEEWVKRVATRPRRDTLCRGILELIRQDSLRYGYCGSTSGIQRAFVMVRKRQDMWYGLKLHTRPDWFGPGPAVRTDRIHQR